MKKRFVPLYTIVLFSLFACSNYLSSENNNAGTQTTTNDSSSNSSIDSSSEFGTSDNEFYIGNVPSLFIYCEIEYTYERGLDVTEVDLSDFNEEELVAVIINPDDEEKFLSENHACDYIIYDTLYNHYDENNRLYVYRYKDYDVSEYLVVYTKMFSILFRGEI
jgi:hypothetical protein